jgi:hypothetical protein
MLASSTVREDQEIQTANLNLWCLIGAPVGSPVVASGVCTKGIVLYFDDTYHHSNDELEFEIECVNKLSHF